MSSVIHPDHYNNGRIEAWDYIKDQGFDFDLGNAIKYITRAGKKNGVSKREDLEKAINYINHEMDSDSSPAGDCDGYCDTCDQCDEEVIWSARLATKESVNGEIEMPDIELSREVLEDGQEQYYLFVETIYQFTSREREVAYLTALKDLFASYILETNQVADYEITYNDNVCIEQIYGATPYEVYEKFRFFVDAFVREVTEAEE